MLPRSQRLTTRAFAKAFAQGRTTRHPLLQVRVAPRGELRAIVEPSNHGTSEHGAPRAAFVVAKKLTKAARRNRLRRQLRECYRLNPHRHDARLRDLDLIFLAAPAALNASCEELNDAVNQLLFRTLRAQPTSPPREN